MLYHIKEQDQVVNLSGLQTKICSDERHVIFRAFWKIWVDIITINPRRNAPQRGECSVKQQGRLSCTTANICHKSPFSHGEQVCVPRKKEDKLLNFVSRVLMA